jgi:hypothetical protein
MVEETLYRWLRLDITNEPFPREVGRYRVVVGCLDEFVNWFNESKGSEFCWSCVFSNDQIVKSGFDTVFLDFDFGKNGWRDEQLKIFKEFIDVVVTMFPRVRLYYSGAKGFHVYLDFDGEYFFNSYRQAVRMFCREFVGNYILPDMQAAGDVRRMARVVGNVRSNGKKMVELNPFDDVDDWMGYIERGEDAEGVELCVTSDNRRGVTYLLALDRDYAFRVEDDIKERVLSRQSRQTLEKIPPCVVKCYTELVDTGELDHSGRVLLANWLIHAGFEEDKVVDVFRVAKDFKEHYTRYQVEYLFERKYHLPSCRKIMADGYCPYKCELYPWMEAGSS